MTSSYTHKAIASKELIQATKLHAVTDKVVLLGVCALLIDEWIPGLYFVQDYNALWRISVLVVGVVALWAVFQGLRSANNLLRWFVSLALAVGGLGVAIDYFHTGALLATSLFPMLLVLAGLYVGQRRLADPVFIVLIVALLISLAMDLLRVPWLQSLRVTRTITGGLNPVAGTVSFRWFGVAATPNVMGLGCVYMFLLSLPYMSRKKPAFVLLSFLSGSGVLLSLSRGALLALIGGGLWLAREMKTRIRSGIGLTIYLAVSLLVTVLTVATIAGVDWQQYTFSTRVTDAPEAFDVRFELFQNAVSLALANPIFGVGINNYGVVGEGLGLPLGAHVWMLELVLGRGLPYTILIIGLVIMAFLCLATFKDREANLRYTSVMIAILLFGMTGGYAGAWFPYVMLGYIVGRGAQTVVSAVSMDQRAV